MKTLCTIVPIQDSHLERHFPITTPAVDVAGVATPPKTIEPNHARPCLVFL